MKRKGDRLTGGTNDVNPQWYKADTTISNTTAVNPGGTIVRNRIQRFLLPVNRINQTQANTATVMELLKVRWSWKNAVSYPSGSEVPFSTNTAMYLSTAPLADDTINPQSRGTTIDWVSFDDFVQPFLLNITSNTFTPFAQTSPTLPVEHDLTDGDGHGVLVATDAVNLLLRVQITNEFTSGGGNILLDSSSCLCEVLYRYKTVSLTEFIGIVQSQERGN